MRKTWQIRGPFGEFLIVRSAELRANETNSIEPPAFVAPKLLVFRRQELALSMSKGRPTELFE